MTQNARAPGRLARGLLLALGTALALDGALLLAAGRTHFGTLLPGGLGLAFLFMGWRWPALVRWRSPPAPAWRRRLWRLGWAGFGVWLISVAMFFAFIARDHGSPPDEAAAPAVILVLGAGAPGCQASPVLALRLDGALASARRWPQARVVVSGGQNRVLRCTEAGVMARYLIERGLPENRLLLEPRSTSTADNMRLSRQLLAERAQPDSPVLIVTSDFHTLRARLIAQKAGFAHIISQSTPTPLAVRYNTWLREYFAFISGWLLREY